MRRFVVTMRVSPMLVWHGAVPSPLAGTEIQPGEVLHVVAEFWRNGEGWIRLADGREVPDVFAEELTEEEA